MQTAAATENDHPIDRYIAKRQAKNPKFNKQALADLIGVSRVALYRVMSGDKAVSIDLLDKIEAATDGEIDSTELYLAWKAARARARA